MRTPRAAIFALSIGPLAVWAVSLAPAAPEAARSPGPAVSPVVFPPQQIPLRFDHRLHLEELGLDCDDCHQSAPTSSSSLDDLIPPESACAMCHPIDRDRPRKEVEAGTPAARCDACHPGFDPGDGFVARVRIPRPNLKFDHEAHVERGAGCRSCHGDLAAEGVGLATRAQLPKMKLCLGCHDGDRAPDACTTCHLTDAGGFVRTDYQSGRLAPSGTLRGADHDLTFRTSHRFAAQNDPAYCESCHRKSFCVDCHNGVVKPMDFHGGDYISMHPIDARRNRPDCTACHRLQTFCVGCHSRSGVSPDDRGTEFGPTRPFHPPGWVDRPVQAGMPRGEDHHSFQAQRNIRQCAACHREDFCTECHSAERTNPFRINPHPNDWANSRRCRALAARAERMCLRCHIDPAEVSCRPR